jgi:hypothetical protein
MRHEGETRSGAVQREKEATSLIVVKEVGKDDKRR